MNQLPKPTRSEPLVKAPPQKRRVEGKPAPPGHINPAVQKQKRERPVGMSRGASPMGTPAQVPPRAQGSLAPSRTDAATSTPSPMQTAGNTGTSANVGKEMVPTKKMPSNIVTPSAAPKPVVSVADTLAQANSALNDEKYMVPSMKSRPKCPTKPMPQSTSSNFGPLVVPTEEVRVCWACGKEPVRLLGSCNAGNPFSLCAHKCLDALKRASTTASTNHTDNIGRLAKMRMLQSQHRAIQRDVVENGEATRWTMRLAIHLTPLCNRPCKSYTGQVWPR